MPHPQLTILYVTDPAASIAFYTQLLGCAPAEASGDFAMFRAPGAGALALWRGSAVMPPAAPQIGGVELVFMVGGPAEVDATHAAWAARGVALLSAPVDAEFGRSFMAADPDGHRLRVLAPA